jgi:hypothetical protein
VENAKNAMQGGVRVRGVVGDVDLVGVRELQPVFFEVFFPSSLTSNITDIVVGNLAPLHIL